ncbi:MAG: sensor domain-containing diguanylate cyclase [Gammaproteobacteria bacterium]
MKAQLHLQFPPTNAEHTLPESPTPGARLEKLISAARHNEAAWRRFRALELALMSADGLDELLDLLLVRAPVDMEWDAVDLQLLDGAHEVRRLLASRDPADRPAGAQVRWLTAESQCAAHFVAREPLPRLGRYQPGRHEDLFATLEAPPASVAMLPLQRRGRWLGTYAIGSRDPDRFHHALGTDFLQHLAAVISICLETAINREQLRRLGLTDALTAVGNRRYFDQRLNEEMMRAQRARASLGCLFVDVDHFKGINDRYGHAVGDEVLQTIAQRIRSQLRGADIVARYGGEEFSVLLPQADLARAAEVAERIRRAIAEAPVAISGSIDLLAVTASIGVATYTGTDGDAEAHTRRLLSAADTALYRAKQQGRNRVERAR